MAREQERLRAERAWIESPDEPVIGDLADDCGVSRKTISRWRESYDWDIRRAQYWRRFKELSSGNVQSDETFGTLPDGKMSHSGTNGGAYADEARHQALAHPVVLSTAARILGPLEVLADLSDIARGRLGRVVRLGAAGLELRADLADLPDEDHGTIQEVSSTVNEKETKLKIKAYSRLDALKELAKHHGLYPAAGRQVDDDATTTQAGAIALGWTDPLGVLSASGRPPETPPSSAPPPSLADAPGASQGVHGDPCELADVSSPTPEIWDAL